MKDKMKNKGLYESPVTKETPVNLESGICGSSITNDQGKGSEVKATQQEYVEYDFGEADSTYSYWD